MNIDIDKLLREYFRHVRERITIRKPRIDYYILTKYLDGITTPCENILVAGMMASYAIVYELIRDSRKETYEPSVRYRGTYV